VEGEFRKELQQHGIAFEEGQHTVERILNADEIVKKPGYTGEERAGEAGAGKGDTGDQRDRAGVPSQGGEQDHRDNGE